MEGDCGGSSRGESVSHLERKVAVGNFVLAREYLTENEELYFTIRLNHDNFSTVEWLQLRNSGGTVPF